MARSSLYDLHYFLNRLFWRIESSIVTQCLAAYLICSYVLCVWFINHARSIEERKQNLSSVIPVHAPVRQANRIPILW